MTVKPALDPDLLPASLREIAECIGLPATLALVQAFGGGRICVPERFDPESSLTRCLGPAATRSLIAEFEREQLYIPKCAAALRAARNAEIHARYRAGETALTLGRAYGLTEYAIYRIVAAIDAAACQQQLFE